MSTTVKPLLDLDTLEPDRPVVKIRTAENRRGKHYEIATLDDLSLQERAQLGQLQRRIRSLEPEIAGMLGEDGEIPDDDALVQFEAVIDEFLALVIVGLPADLISKLKLPQKEQLMGVFTEASPPETKARVEAAMKKATSVK